MTIKNFQGLIVWQKGHQFVLSIYNLTRQYPKDEKFGIVNQIRRSSSSICANIAEGYKKSTKDFGRFLDIAQGSLEETKYHLILSKDLGYIDKKIFDELFEQADEIGKMLFGLIKNVRGKIGS